MFGPHAIVKFQQNRLVQTTQILSFLKKNKTKQKQKKKTFLKLFLTKH